MRAGELRHRVTIETRTEISDGHDGYTTTWAVARARLPAKVAPLQGRELERARQVDPRISHAVEFRYWRDYPAELKGGRARLIYHDVTDRTFEIVGAPVDVGEQHVALTVQCKESV